jgi:hypothetical protein
MASVGTVLYVSSGSSSGVYKLDGTTWVKVGGGSPGDTIDTTSLLAIGKTLYAGTNAKGIYQLNTEEPDGTWTKVGGFDWPGTIPVMISMDNVIYAATNGAGVYYLDWAQQDWKPLGG